MTDRAPRAPRPLAIVLAVLAVVASLALLSPAAPASAAPTTSVPSDPAAGLPLTKGDELGNSLPKPNSGTAPHASGDRGGSAQVALFYVMLGGTVFIALMITREVRKGRRRLAASQPSS